jgi:hypothetical protein
VSDCRTLRVVANPYKGACLCGILGEWKTWMLALSISEGATKVALAFETLQRKEVPITCIN